MTEQNSELPLSGQRILLTRPAAQQQSLRKAIEQAGGCVTSQPLLEIHALEEAKAKQSAINLIQHLDHYQFVIFISTNAVQFGGDLIEDYWPQFPAGVQVIAIGESTAREASSRFACTVVRPSAGGDSEAVLALPELALLQDSRVAIIRGQGGRELLAKTLGDRGASVDYIEVYRRCPARLEADDFAARLFNPPCSAITVHSGESLLRLIELSADNIDKVTLLPLVVPSSRVAEQAREAGFRQVFNAGGATDAAMVATLTTSLAHTTC